MTDGIKPKGGAGPVADPSATGPEDPEKGSGRSISGVSFDEVLGSEGTEAKGAIDAAARAGARDPSGGVESGAAIDRLVANALESSAAKNLSPEGRAALEAHLRRVLEEDPTLAALRRELEVDR